MSANGFTVEPAIYARNMMAVRTTDDFGSIKGRAARLLGHLNARYSRRESAYILSPSKVAKLRKLYAEGRNASGVTGELRE